MKMKKWGKSLIIWLLFCGVIYLLGITLQQDFNNQLNTNETTTSNMKTEVIFVNKNDINSNNNNISVDNNYIPNYIVTNDNNNKKKYDNYYCAKGLTGLRNMKYNIFSDTLLNDYVTYHWRPCKEEWQFEIGSLNHSLLATPPVIFKLFDWVIWQHDRVDYKDPLIVFGNHSENNNPRTVLVYPETKSTSYLKRQLKKVKELQFGQRRSLVIAGQDSGLGGKLQRYIHKHFLNYFSDIWCTAKNRQDPFVHTIPLGLNPFYIVKAGVHEVTSFVNLYGTPTHPKRVLWSFRHVVQDVMHPPKEVNLVGGVGREQENRKLVFAGDDSSSS